MTTRTLIVCDGCDAEVEEVEAKDEWCLGLTLTTSGGGKRNTLKETIGTFDLCQVCTQKMVNYFNPKAWVRVNARAVAGG